MRNQSLIVCIPERFLREREILKGKKTKSNALDFHEI